MGKRNKNIYESIYTFENIYLASLKARRGKRFRSETEKFEINIEENIIEIMKQLKNKSYVFGEYKTFIITDPKEREISAAPYKDRVVHHAICNIIEPIIDKAMIYDTYACRKGKGTHKAITRAEEFIKGSKWILKIDIKKYFFTIDHEILLSKITDKIGDKEVIAVISDIMNTYTSKREYYYPFWGDTLFDCIRKRGLPIGNLTSQIFANFYLDSFDRFIKEELKVKKYVRYMDDMLLFGDTKEELIEIKEKSIVFLEKQRLKINEKKTQIFPVRNGVKFLGFHIYEHYKKILRENLIRFRKRLKMNSFLYRRNDLSFESILLSLNSWIGYAGKNNTNISNKILEYIKFKKESKPNFNFEFSYKIGEKNG